MSDTFDPLAKSRSELAVDAKHLGYIAETIKTRLLDRTPVADLIAEFHALSLGAKRLHRDAQRTAQSHKSRQTAA